MGNPLRGDVLDSARRQAGLSPSELWFRYLELGGIDSPLEFDAYLFGALRPTDHEQDLLAHALNERFAELGHGHPVPYLNARITLGDRLGLVRALLWETDGAGQGSWDRVCAACAEALAITGTGISLLDGDQLTSLGTSDRAALMIDDAHFTFEEGPGVDAGRLGVAVHEPDLAASGPARWPDFTAAALDAGVAAVFAFPLRLGAVRLGTLLLYRDAPGPLSGAQQADAPAIAKLVTHTVLALQADAAPGTLSVRLPEIPMGDNVHQATGMVAAQLDIGVADALARLRLYASAHDSSIEDIAARVVARTLRFDDQTD
jgi:hypothetical protein